jgi:hypothetical protein
MDCAPLDSMVAMDMEAQLAGVVLGCGATACAGDGGGDAGGGGGGGGCGGGASVILCRERVAVLIM